MLRYDNAAWHWDDQALELMDPEPALLTAMLRAPGQRRQPHVWLALSLQRPYAPASGRAFLFTLQSKLQWAGAPFDLIATDATLGASLPADVPLALDGATRAAAGLLPAIPPPANQEASGA